MNMTPTILTSPAPERSQAQVTILQALESAATEYRELVTPPSNALPPPVFPSGRDSLGELSQSNRLEQGMREMSLVLENMVEGRACSRDLEWGSDPEGRRLVVGPRASTSDLAEQFHGNPMYKEFYN